MNKSVQKYIAENLSTILKILSIYVIGVIIGIILFVFTDIKTEYVDIVKNIFEQTKQENFEGINVIANGIKNNFFFIGILYLSMLTIISPIILSAVILLKAIVTGIYSCTIFCIFGMIKGILVFLLNVVLPVILALMGYVVICTNIICIFNSINTGEKIPLKEVLKQIYWLVISVSLIVFSSVIEQLTTGVVFNLYMNI